MLPLGLEGQDRVPKDFGEMNAIEALGVQVPHHVEARWRIIDPEMKVEKLFGLERTANKTLMGWQLNFLSSYCGTTAYTEVPVKTKNRELSKMGLVELTRHFAHQKCHHARQDEGLDVLLPGLPRTTRNSVSRFP